MIKCVEIESLLLKSWYCWLLRTAQMDHRWWWRSGRDCGWIGIVLAAPQATFLREGPHIDWILDEVIVGSRSSCGRVTFRRSFHWVCNFDLGPRQLAHLADFSTQFSDYAATWIIWNGEFMTRNLNRYMKTCSAFSVACIVGESDCCSANSHSWVKSGCMACTVLV